MKSISEIKHTFTPSLFRDERDELVSKLTNLVNIDRIKGGYKTVTKKFVAIKLNMNPFLKSDSELRMVLKKCQEKGNCKYFWWCVKKI